MVGLGGQLGVGRMEEEKGGVERVVCVEWKTWGNGVWGKSEKGEDGGRGPHCVGSVVALVVVVWRDLCGVGDGASRREERTTWLSVHKQKTYKRATEYTFLSMAALVAGSVTGPGQGVVVVLLLLVMAFTCCCSFPPFPIVAFAV